MLVLSPRNTPFRDYETFLPLSRRTTISSSDWPFYPSGNSTRPTFLDDGATTTSDRNDCRFALPTSAFGEGRGVLHFYEILRPHPTVHNTPATALSAWRRVRVLFSALSSCNSCATIYTKSILHLSPSPSLAREMSLGQETANLEPFGACFRSGKIPSSFSMRFALVKAAATTRPRRCWKEFPRKYPLALPPPISTWKNFLPFDRFRDYGCLTDSKR